MKTPEHELIRRHFAPLAGPEGLGLVDDAAEFEPPPGSRLVVTSDLVAEGIHFFADDPPGAIAAKALRVNLSDLAAKGATPLGYTLALALRPETEEGWIARFAAGLGADQKRYGVRLFGGDTSDAAGGTTIAVTAFGSVPTGGMVRRSGARPGDAVAVTGTIGDAALGLLARRSMLPAIGDDARDYLIGRYRFPEPRVGLSEVLRTFASAAMDVSDGLVGDLGKLCEASGVGARIDLGAVPFSEPAAAAIALESGLSETCLTGGDDYEILATVPRAKLSGAMAAAAAKSVAFAVIGEIVEGAPIPVFVGADSQAVTFAKTSFEHFRDESDGR